MNTPTVPALTHCIDPVPGLHVREEVFSTGPALPPSSTKVSALDHVQSARPRQPRPDMAYAQAGSRIAGVHLDLGTHEGGNGKNGKNGDSRDAAFEEF
jgi:hypothetical protein